MNLYKHGVLRLSLKKGEGFGKVEKWYCKVTCRDRQTAGCEQRRTNV